MTEHMGEVVVIEVHAIGIVVIICKISLTIHKNLHWFTALLNPSDEKDATNRDPHHEKLYPHRQKVVEPTLNPLTESHGLKTILHVEVFVRINGGIVNSTNHPGWAVNGANNRIFRTCDGVRAPHPP